MATENVDIGGTLPAASGSGSLSIPEQVTIGGQLPAASGSASLLVPVSVFVGGALPPAGGSGAFGVVAVVNIGGQLPAASGSASMVKLTCAQSEAPWKIFIEGRAEASALWAVGSWVHAQNEAPWPILLELEHETPYSIGIWVLADLSARWKIWLEKDYESAWLILVEREMESILAVRAEAESEAVYALLWPVAAERVAPFAILDYNIVAAQFISPYNALAEGESEAVWAIAGMVFAEASAPYTGTAEVAAQAEGPFAILAVNPVFAEAVSPWILIHAPAINITGQPVIKHGGRTIGIIDAAISADEDGYAWAATIALADPADYARMAVDDEFILDLYGEEFILIVDNKTANRTGPGQMSLSISAISPSARLASPRAAPFTKTWGETSARAAAEEAAGAAIDWRIPDWVIPAGRLAFTDSEPIAVVRRIAEAAGGVVETKPSGALLVRHRFPVRVPDWGGAPPDHVYTDAQDNLSATEMYKSLKRVNRLVIRDFTVEKSARVEYVRDPKSARGGQLRVYPRPWRPVSVAHTGAPHVVLRPIGNKLRVEEELVEFRAGKGSTGWPVYQIESVEWRKKNLGAVSFEQDGSDLTAGEGGYSLAFVRYKTRSTDAEVSDPVDETVQFLVMEA